MCESIGCSTSLSILGVITFLNFSHFSRYAVVFHCVLICFTQITSDVVHTAMCLLAIFVSSFEKCLLKYSAHV